MCSYSAKATDNSAVTIAPTHRITSIAGETVSHYLTDVRPCPVGGIRPTLGRTELVVIEPLTFAGGVVTAGTAKTFKAQVEFLQAREHGGEVKRTPDMPKAKGYLMLLAGDQSKVSKLLEVKFADNLEGKAFANCYSFARVTRGTTGQSDDAGDPGSGTPTSTSIPFLSLLLTEQYRDMGSKDEKIGDICVVVDRESVTPAQLEAADYFTLTPAGGSATRYTLWNHEGIKYPVTHHYEIYLQRLK